MRMLAYLGIAGLRSFAMANIGVLPDSVEPTELAGIAECETESAHAWALDIEDDPPQRLTPRRITTAAIAGSLTLVAAAGVVSLLYLGGTSEPLPPVMQTTVVVAPPEPSATPEPAPRVTFTADVPAAGTLKPPPPVYTPPPPRVAVDRLAAYDQQFIANLRANLWAIWDPARIADQGHWVCMKLEQGLSPLAVSQLLFGITPGEQQSFVSTAMATYPNCP